MKSSTMGLNRTGIQASPIDGKRAIEGAQQGSPQTLGGSESLDWIRKEYVAEGEPLGSVPVPATLKGALKTLFEAVKGHGPAAFLDKLGERLAFERTGTRLYEALLAKHDATPPGVAAPTRAELVRFHDEERGHFDLLRGVIEELGADPTAITPAADVVAVASQGLLQVVADPRTTLAQSLHAILIAELADNEGWQMLIDLARALGKDDLALRFVSAQDEEAIHLASVRRWVSVEVAQEAKVAA